MVFSSYAFILVFLPLVIASVYASRHLFGKDAALATLLLASWAFYAYWDWRYLPLLILSIIGNYACAMVLTRLQSHRLAIVVFGIGSNLALLAYFKYANFFVDNIESISGVNFNFAYVILPIGISFFTFQQIAFLADVYKGKKHDATLLEYSVFVSFFPQLIAGPIVHHRELVPQLTNPDLGALRSRDLSLGAMIFVVGLSKKVLIADTLARYADPLYSAAAGGAPLSSLEAWGAAVAYGLQLYFDFSGYADMAIGLGLMFGIHLPANFDRPYAATSIRDFWRRWHMTLSRFLRDYVYIPLGGSHKGTARQYINLMLTMALGGIWHGAAWTFLFWGLLHGAYLSMERALATVFPNAGTWRLVGPALPFFGWLVTITLVFVAWVPFRAESFDSTLLIWDAMFTGPILPDAVRPYLPAELLSALGAFGFHVNGPVIISLSDWAIGIPLILAFLLLSLVMPNGEGITSWIYAKESDRLLDKSRWRAMSYGALTACLLIGSLIGLTYNTVFLYFQF